MAAKKKKKKAPAKKAVKAKKAPARKAVKKKAPAKTAAKKAVKKAAKKAPAKKTAATKSPVKKAAAKKAPAKKAVVKKVTPVAVVTTTPVTAVKTAPKPRKKKQIVGEGDYAASKAFDTDQAAFVKSHKAEIPALGKEAEAALDGPEGEDLKAAETEAASHSKEGPEE